jgi:hypothetical protein
MWRICGIELKINKAQDMHPELIFRPTLVELYCHSTVCNPCNGESAIKEIKIGQFITKILTLLLQ